MTFPKNTENSTTGAIEANIVKVNCHESTKRNTKETITNIMDLMNIATVVESPSYMTDVSDPNLDTIFKRAADLIF